MNITTQNIKTYGLYNSIMVGTAASTGPPKKKKTGLV
jgi:hypothetical protein